MDSPPFPGSSAALFLDFDGTLVELAETPGSVRLPHELASLLGELQTLLRGALAVVSGRPIEELDAMLAPLRLPIAGEHGALRRDGQGRLHPQPAPALDAALAAAERLAAHHAGLLVERKRAAIALHYRQAPALERLCLQTMADAIADQPGLALLHGKCVVEVKPAAIDKGQAIDAFLREPPFAGRQPVFLGDDTTDEAGFAAVQAHAGGIGIKVGPGATQAAYRLAHPAQVSAWLSAFRDRLATKEAAA